MSIGVRKVNRVAIAVRSLDRARAFFERHFGAEFGPVEDVAVDGYRYVPFTLAGFTLELLEPYDPRSPIARFLEKRGEGLYQLSLTVDDTDAAAATLRAEGLTVIGPRTYDEDVVLEGCRWKEAFVHPKDAHGVLIFIGERTPVFGTSPPTVRPGRPPPPPTGGRGEPEDRDSFAGYQPRRDRPSRTIASATTTLSRAIQDARTADARVGAGDPRARPEDEVVERAQEERQDDQPELPVEPRGPEQERVQPEVQEPRDDQERQRVPADRPEAPPGLLHEPLAEAGVPEPAADRDEHEGDEQHAADPGDGGEHVNPAHEQTHWSP